MCHYERLQTLIMSLTPLCHYRRTLENRFSTTLQPFRALDSCWSLQPSSQSHSTMWLWGAVLQHRRSAFTDLGHLLVTPALHLKPLQSSRRAVLQIDLKPFRTLDSCSWSHSTIAQLQGIEWSAWQGLKAASTAQHSEKWGNSYLKTVNGTGFPSPSPGRPSDSPWVCPKCTLCTFIEPYEP